MWSREIIEIHETAWQRVIPKLQQRKMDQSPSEPPYKRLLSTEYVVNLSVWWTTMLSPSFLSSRRQCWVCFANEEDEPEAEWTSPCRCRGGTKWVHQVSQNYHSSKELANFRRIHTKEVFFGCQHVIRAHFLIYISSLHIYIIRYGWNVVTMIVNQRLIMKGWGV